MHALKVLEYDTVREELARRCETSIGAEYARSLTPSFGADQVWDELGLTVEACELMNRAAPPALAPVRDLREAFRRAEKGGTLGGQELFQCAECLAAMRQLRQYVEHHGDVCPRLARHTGALPQHPRLEEAVLSSLESDGTVKDAASAVLAQIRRKKAATQGRIVERIRSYVSGKTRELLSEALYTIRDGRYVLPVKAEHKSRIKGIVHDTSASGQTVYVEPEDVLQLANQLREAESAEREEEGRVLFELSHKVGAVARPASEGIESASYADFAFAKARLARDWGGVSPIECDGHGIEITEGRHPLLDRETVVPLSLRVGWETPGLLITGPNTGGKTVAIKTVGLFAAMAQSGLLPPADQIRLGPFTQIWADIGDEQSIAQSLSTFSGHIRNIGEALAALRPGALVLLDEIGAGTDPVEGAALAKAILSAFREGGAAILASTHYGELKAFAYNVEGFQNAAMEFDEETLAPTYRLMMGAPGASHALRVAAKHGIPEHVIESAVAALSEEQRDLSQILEKLERVERSARDEHLEASRRAAEIERLEAEARRKLEEAREIRRTVHARAEAMIEDALREIRQRATLLFEELKEAAGDARAIERIRGDLKELQSAGQHLKAQFEEPANWQRPSPAEPLSKGQTVRVAGYGQSGVLLEDPVSGMVSVQMGPLRVKVPISQVTPVAAPPAKQRTARHNIGLQKAFTARTELYLRHMRAEPALEQLERFLDEAVLAGLDRVRIVHGKGGGVLKKLTHDFLKKSPHVKSFRLGEPAEGGAGVTVALLQ